MQFISKMRFKNDKALNLLTHLRTSDHRKNLPQSTYQRETQLINYPFLSIFLPYICLFFVQLLIVHLISLFTSASKALLTSAFSGLILNSDF